MKFYIGPEIALTVEMLDNALRNNAQAVLSEEAQMRITRSRMFLEEHMRQMSSGGRTVYGINTGFGAFSNVGIDEDALDQLQENLIVSHACGAGEEASADIVRLMLLLKAQALSYGHSGIRLELVQRLVDFYNNDLLPVVYVQGSLGASGDLSPLSHLALPIIGKGEVHLRGERMPASDALKKIGIEPLRLKAKEGLALNNGTQFMSACGVWCLHRAMRLAKAADQIGALSVEGFCGFRNAYRPEIHAIRPHRGQQDSAERILKFLEGSAIIDDRGPKEGDVQDFYSLRCMPQVHGASRDAIDYAVNTIITEINGVSDNPLIFPDADDDAYAFLSGGNFHGQPLALALDFLAIAVAELGSISERRSFLMLSGRRQLPAFLTLYPGLHNGFMIPQYTAASIVSLNKQLCTPASVDSIPSSNGKEDHVSMGANAAVKCMQVINNVETVFGIEIMSAAQAVHYRNGQLAGDPNKGYTFTAAENFPRSSPALRRLMNDYRRVVPALDKDRVLQPDIAASTKFVREYDFQ